MANTAKRKQLVILGLFLVIGGAVAFLMLSDIPAPQSEKVIELDAGNVLKP